MFDGGRRGPFSSRSRRHLPDPRTGRGAYAGQNAAVSPGMVDAALRGRSPIGREAPSPSIAASAPEGGGAPRVADYMALPEVRPPPASSWQTGENHGTPIPETVRHQERESAQRVEAERLQRLNVASSVNITAAPIEVVHRNGTDGSVLRNERLPITAVPVPGGIGPRPPGVN